MNKTSKPFDYTKPFRMKNGKSARLLADDVKHDDKIVGLVVLCNYEDGGYNYISRYNLDETEYYKTNVQKDCTDLVNIPETTKTYYAIFENGSLCNIRNNPTNHRDAFNFIYFEYPLHRRTISILELVKEDNVVVSYNIYPYKKV